MFELRTAAGLVLAAASVLVVAVTATSNIAGAAKQIQASPQMSPMDAVPAYFTIKIQPET